MAAQDSSDTGYRRDTVPEFPRGINELLNKLTDRALNNMTREELEWTVHASELAEYAALSLAETTEGIGMLIDSDDEKHTKRIGIASGALQGRDAMHAFCVIANGLQTIAGLAYAGHYAAVKLLHPETYGYPLQADGVRSRLDGHHE